MTPRLQAATRKPLQRRANSSLQKGERDVADHLTPEEMPSILRPEKTPTSFLHKNPRKVFNWLLAGLIGGSLVSGVWATILKFKEKKALQEVQDMPLIPGNPVVYLELANNGVILGKLVFQLRADIVPLAAENFRALCTGEHGIGYRSSSLHGIERHSRIYGGDFFGTGSAGFSIYGSTFPDEDFQLKHCGPGALAVRSFGPDRNSSQFYITLRALPSLDGSHQVIGYMLEGWDLLRQLDGMSMSAAPRFVAGSDIRIHSCGVLPEYKVKGQLAKLEAEQKRKELEALLMGQGEGRQLLGEGPLMSGKDSLTAVLSDVLEEQMRLKQQREFGVPAVTVPVTASPAAAAAAAVGTGEGKQAAKA